MTEVHYCYQCDYSRSNGITGAWLCHSPVLHSPDYVGGGVVGQDCRHLREGPICRGYVKRAPRPAPPPKDSIDFVTALKRGWNSFWRNR